MDASMPWARVRFDQLEAIISTPRAAYTWAKLIDGDPREGTTLIMGQRVRAFCELRRRQMFYEPLSNYDSILGTLQLMWQLGEGGHLGPGQRDGVVIAFNVYESAYTAPRGHIALPQPGERLLGLHAVYVVGWMDSGETLRFVNSWGTSWGDRGCGTVSRAYLDRYLGDAYLMRDARYGFTRFDRGAIERATTAKELVRVWTRENPRWREWVKHRGSRRRLHLYETYSAQDSVPVTVLEVRTGEDMRLGWAMLFHEADGISVLKELFVWPPFRREGYGSLLEEVAVSQARGWHSTKIKLFLHSADALPRTRVAGRTFGLAAGYEWRWRRTALPNLDAIGEKEL